MDAHDVQVRQELERRLAVISSDEADDPVHGPLSTVDLVWLAAIVAAAIVLGIVVTL